MTRLLIDAEGANAGERILEHTAKIEQYNSIEKAFIFKGQVNASGLYDLQLSAALPLGKKRSSSGASLASQDPELVELGHFKCLIRVRAEKPTKFQAQWDDLAAWGVTAADDKNLPVCRLGAKLPPISLTLTDNHNNIISPASVGFVEVKLTTSSQSWQAVNGSQKPEAENMCRAKGKEDDDEYELNIKDSGCWMLVPNSQPEVTDLCVEEVDIGMWVEVYTKASTHKNKELLVALGVDDCLPVMLTPGKPEKLELMDYTVGAKNITVPLHGVLDLEDGEDFCLKFRVLDGFNYPTRPYKSHLTKRGGKSKKSKAKGKGKDDSGEGDDHWHIVIEPHAESHGTYQILSEKGTAEVEDDTVEITGLGVALDGAGDVEAYDKIYSLAVDLQGNDSGARTKKKSQRGSSTLASHSLQVRVAMNTKPDSLDGWFAGSNESPLERLDYGAWDQSHDDSQGLDPRGLKIRCDFKNNASKSIIDQMRTLLLSANEVKSPAVGEGEPDPQGGIQVSFLANEGKVKSTCLVPWSAIFDDTDMNASAVYDAQYKCIKFIVPVSSAKNFANCNTWSPKRQEIEFPVTIRAVFPPSLGWPEMTSAKMNGATLFPGEPVGWRIYWKGESDEERKELAREKKKKKNGKPRKPKKITVRAGESLSDYIDCVCLVDANGNIVCDPTKLPCYAGRTKEAPSMKRLQPRVCFFESQEKEKKDKADASAEDHQDMDLESSAGALSQEIFLEVAPGGFFVPNPKVQKKTMLNLKKGEYEVRITNTTENFTSGADEVHAKFKAKKGRPVFLKVRARDLHCSTFRNHHKKDESRRIKAGTTLQPQHLEVLLLDRIEQETLIQADEEVEITVTTSSGSFTQTLTRDCEAESFEDERDGPGRTFYALENQVVIDPDEDADLASPIATILIDGCFTDPSVKKKKISNAKIECCLEPSVIVTDVRILNIRPASASASAADDEPCEPSSKRSRREGSGDDGDTQVVKVGCDDSMPDIEVELLLSDGTTKPFDPEDVTRLRVDGKMQGKGKRKELLLGSWDNPKPLSGTLGAGAAAVDEASMVSQFLFEGQPSPEEGGYYRAGKYEVKIHYEGNSNGESVTGKFVMDISPGKPVKLDKAKKQGNRRGTVNIEQSIMEHHDIGSQEDLVLCKKVSGLEIGPPLRPPVPPSLLILQA